VLLALEYLRILDVVYWDLKPEIVLVREEGHDMLSVEPVTLTSPQFNPLDSLAFRLRIADLYSSSSPLRSSGYHCRPCQTSSVILDSLPPS
jgi:hypothetical protein